MADATDGNQAFWASFYAHHELRHEPSPFAQWCLQHQLHGVRRVLDLGCGDGRDTFALLNQGLAVLGVDACRVVVAENRHHLGQWCQQVQGDFWAHDLVDAEALEADLAEWRPDAIYTRFFLHAIPEPVEDRVLALSGRLLPSGGLMLHEFRTTRDPLMQQGEALSATERWTDHYRRFIDTERLRRKLAAWGWQEQYFCEGNGLAVFGSEDPVVGRLVARKP